MKMKPMMSAALAATMLGAIAAPEPNPPPYRVLDRDGAVYFRLNGERWSAGRPEDCYIEIPRCMQKNPRLVNSGGVSWKNGRSEIISCSGLYHCGGIMSWGPFRAASMSDDGGYVRLYDRYDTLKAGTPLRWRFLTDAKVTRDGADLVLEKNGKKVRAVRLYPFVYEQDWKLEPVEGGLTRIVIEGVGHRSTRTEFGVAFWADWEKASPPEPRVGPRTQEADFFAGYLNTAIPEMAEAKAKAAAGDLVGARKVFADYVRGVLRAKPRAWRKASGDYAATLKRRAETIMGGTFSSVGVATNFPNRIVDWECNPTKNEYGEWTWQVNRAGAFAALAEYYEHSMDEKVAEAYAFYANGWIDREFLPNDIPPPGTSAWRSLDTGIRMISMVERIRAFIDSPVMTDEFLTRLMISVREHGYRVRRYHSRDGNWFITELKGLVKVAVNCSFLAEASEWMKFALDEIAYSVDDQIMPDGFAYELSTGYHTITENDFYEMYYFLEAAGITPPREVPVGLERMFTFDYRLSRPDRRHPDVNDGGKVDIRRQMPKAKRMFPDRTDYRWFIDPPDNAGGVEPAEKSFVMEYSGLATFRDSWSRDAVWGYIDLGPLGRGHEHEDKLNMLIYAYGKEMLTEGGISDYDGSRMREYVCSSRAHNVIHIDGGQQCRCAVHGRITRPNTEKAPLEYSLSPAVDWAEAAYTNDFGRPFRTGVTHTRRLAFHKRIEGLKPFFVVDDRLTGADAAKKHVYEAIWHLETNALALASHGFNADFGGGKGLKAVWSDADATVTDMSGTKKPRMQGWMPVRGATDDDSHRAIPTPVVKGAFTGSTRLVTVFYPYDDGTCPVAAVEASKDPAAKDVTLVLADGRRIPLPSGR